MFDGDALDRATRERLVCLQYVASDGAPAERYPANPNGSQAGVPASPPRTPGDDHDAAPGTHRSRRQHSWHPPNWGEHGPWMRMFVNARRWLD